MQQLVKGVLAVGARLTPHDWSGRGRHRATVEPHPLSIALHI